MSILITKMQSPIRMKVIDRGSENQKNYVHHLLLEHRSKLATSLVAKENPIEFTSPQ